MSTKWNFFSKKEENIKIRPRICTNCVLKLAFYNFFLFSVLYYNLHTYFFIQSTCPTLSHFGLHQIYMRVFHGHMSSWSCISTFFSAAIPWQLQVEWLLVKLFPLPSIFEIFLQKKSRPEMSFGFVWTKTKGKTKLKQ